MHKRWMAFPIVLALLVAGYFYGAAPSTQVAGPLGPCAHPYYPTKVGSSVTYATFVGTTPGEYVVTVNENATGTVTLGYQIKGVQGALTQAIACDPSGNLAAQSYLDLASAISGSKFSMQTKSRSGVLLPADLKVGSEWSATYDVNVTPEDNPNLQALGITTINQQVMITRKVVAEERVTVGAGAFDALKVKVTTKVDAALSGADPADAINIETDEWWVKGIGLVKSDSTFNGTRSMMEASSVHIP